MDNLEKEFYNEDGTFKPMTDSKRGNSDGEKAFVRDTYMESEKDYFLELLQDAVVRARFLKLLALDSEFLLEEAQRLEDKLEYGEIETREELEMMKKLSPVEWDLQHLKNLNRVEALITLLRAAASDKVLLKELTKTMDVEEEHMSRHK